MLCRRFCQYILHHVAGCNSFPTVYSSRPFLLPGPHIIDHDIRTREMGGTGHALIANDRNAINWTALASVRDGSHCRALHSDPKRSFFVFSCSATMQSVIRESTLSYVLVSFRRTSVWCDLISAVSCNPMFKLLAQTLQ